MTKFHEQAKFFLKGSFGKGCSVMLNLDTRTVYTDKGYEIEVPNFPGLGESKSGRSIALLEAYLQKSRVVSDSKTKSDAEKAIKNNLRESAEMVEEFRNLPNAKAFIHTKESSLEQQLSQYGMRTKLSYATDADVDPLSGAISMGMASVATAVFGTVAVQDPSTLSATIMVGALGYTLAKGVKTAVAAATEAKTGEQLKDIAEYSNLKHTQLALKLLKREVLAPEKAAARARYKEEVNKLFAAGYGNPGGFVTVPPAENGAKQEAADVAEAKPEKKKSTYWQDVKKLFADGYGNPGGFVTIPPAGKDDKVADTAEKSGKPEKKAEKGSSYKEEVAQLYATYGGASGGFVHNALANKKRGR